ncbi:MAG: alpha/beta hydrolase [Actinomycetota bacterium]|nr:alpha/beta hydrolase [Actinomycetota bacterium]
MLSRRGFLGTFGGALGTAALGGCASRATTPDNGSVQAEQNKPKKIAYGADRSQFGELSRPRNPRHTGTIVIIHGGFWQAQYGLALGRPLAADLVERGFTCWNLEYRRVGNGGGWPTTLEDVAAGIDHLTELDLDTTRVVAVGHSAGGQLAVWAAGRTKLPARAPGASPRVQLTGVVAQAGVLDLAVAAETGVGSGAPQQLVGGTPAAVPERYRVADPIEAVPLAAPVFCLHSHSDQNVPFAQSSAYVAAAEQAGGAARLHETQGDHFTLIDTSSAAWAAARDGLPSLLVGRLPAG